MNDASPHAHLEAPTGQPSFFDEARQLSLGELLQIYHRRKKVLFGTIALIMLLAVLALLQLTPRYTAEADVFVDPRREQVVNIESVIADLPPDAQTIESEIQVLRSRDLAEKLINQLRLDLVPEFNLLRQEEISEDSLLGRLRARIPAGWIDALLGRIPLEDMPKEEAGWRILGAVFDEFSKALEVGPVGHSRVIRVAFTSQDPKLSADVVNTLTTLYVDSQVEAKLAATRRAAEWLDGRVKGLRQTLEAAERAVEAFRTEKGLYEGGTMTALSQQISEIQAQLLLAQIDYEIEKMRRRDGVSIAGARVQALESSLQILTEKVSRTNQDEVQLRALQREADAQRAIFETFLNRSKETEQPGLEQPDARIISRAAVPTQISFPRPIPILTIAFVLAGCIGIAAMFALEAVESGIRSSDQAERQLGVGVLGIVPITESERRLQSAPNLEDYVIERPLSGHAEALRSIHTALLFRKQQSETSQSILLTSAIPGEGKTTLVCSLARVLARAGHRVIAVDCDVRRPSLHELFELRERPGLTDYLNAFTEIKDLVQIDEASQAHFIAAGASVAEPQVLLRSPRMRQLLDYLKTRYDIVLLDSPPVLIVTDALEIAALCDRCVLVVRWRKTRVPAAQHALQKLTDAAAKVAGVVLTQVNLKAHMRNRYGYGNYYYRRYSRYYTE
jgi:capsular exopolysaccharide synthesis family protein